MKEEPNTKLYFDEKIARVVFEADVERKVYWVDTTELHIHLSFHHLYQANQHLLHLYRNLYQANQHLLLPIEEWLKEQGMICVEDDIVLFAMRWG